MIKDKWQGFMLSEMNLPVVGVVIHLRNVASTAIEVRPLHILRSHLPHHLIFLFAAPYWGLLKAIGIQSVSLKRTRDVMGDEMRTLSWITYVLLFIFLAKVVPVKAQNTSSYSFSQTKTTVLHARRPVPLAHLYWHFLIYQNVLDTRTGGLDMQGKNEDSLHNDLQMRIGFSDADFAPIRASSRRLSAELHSLDAQAATIRAAGASPATSVKLHALAAQREAYVNTEIITLKQTLSRERITAFETFITAFFAPKTLKVQITPATKKAIPAEAQR